MGLILVTNVLQYTGPGAVEALLAEDHHVVCHDAAFCEKETRASFGSRRSSLTTLAAQNPEEIYAETLASCGVPDAVVLNDTYPISRNAIEEIPFDDLQMTFEAVVVAPILMTQLFLPSMKKRGKGAFVFVTSARDTQPEQGFAVPTTLRAATTAFAKALAKEAAPFGIQANVVAPNYLYSELYYPRDRFIDDPVGRDTIAKLVPFGRLGEQAEVGALIAFFASGKSPFTTGQVIHFTGGWS
jgi:3-oxoacyl-[acyl-carrier protein] reductase